MQRALASSLASAAAELVTLPTDVAKVRLQMRPSRGAVEYSGLLDCLLKIVRAEGLAACWKGVVPALLRQVLYSTLSLILYEPLVALFGRRLPHGYWLRFCVAPGGLKPP